MVSAPVRKGAILTGEKGGQVAIVGWYGRRYALLPEEKKQRGVIRDNCQVYNYPVNGRDVGFWIYLSFLR